MDTMYTMDKYIYIKNMYIQIIHTLYIYMMYTLYIHSIHMTLDKIYLVSTLCLHYANTLYI